MTAKAYVNYDSTAIERLAMILMVSLSGIGSVLLMRKEYIRFSVCIGIYIFYFLITQIRYNLIGLFMPFMIYFLFNDSRRRRTLGITLGIFFVLLTFWIDGPSALAVLSFISPDTNSDRSALGFCPTERIRFPEENPLEAVAAQAGADGAPI